jgi:hypothetical protein
MTNQGSQLTKPVILITKVITNMMWCYMAVMVLYGSYGVMVLYGSYGVMSVMVLYGSSVGYI